MLTVWLEPKRSARFYGQVYNPPCVGSRSGAALLTKWGETAIIEAERALLLAVGSSYQLIIIFMLTVWHHPGGQHAFMESASAKNTTHSRNFKKICPFQLHPLPTWILRGASQPLFVTTLLSGPFDRAFLSYAKPPCVGSRFGTAQGVCFWGQVVWWAGSSR